VIRAHVAAFLHLCDVEESVAKNHVVRKQLICLDATLWVTVTLALARVDACSSTLEVSACVLHIFAVVHHLNEAVHVCAWLLVRIQALDSAHHCLRPPRPTRLCVMASATRINAGEILCVFLAGCEFVFEPVRQSLLVGFGIVAPFFAAVIKVGVPPFAEFVVPTFMAALVIPAVRCLLDGTVTARVKMRADVNVAA